MNVTLLAKRGTATRWAEVNPILQLGEFGFAYDINQLKIGDGITPWNNLPYINEQYNNGIVNADVKENFPPIGDVNIIYKAQKEKMIYQWNSETQTYEALNATLPTENGILILYGGSATDNIQFEEA